MKDNDNKDMDEADYNGGCVMEIIEGMKLTIILMSILTMMPKTTMAMR